jgi:hypothetical protein
MTAPIPPAVKAVRASLRKATEPGLVVRLQDMLIRLEALYHLRSENTRPDMGDLRRRRFVASSHRGHIETRPPKVRDDTGRFS